MNVSKGIIIAGAVASLFAAGAARAADADKGKAEDKAGSKKVKCAGINSCKGKGECGSAGGSGCHGSNECKGKGWIEVTEKECKEKGGRVL